MSKKPAEKKQRKPESKKESEFIKSLRKIVRARPVTQETKAVLAELDKFLLSDEYKAFKDKVTAVADYLEAHKEELIAAEKAEKKIDVFASFLQMELESSEEYAQLVPYDVLVAYYTAGKEITDKTVIRAIERAKKRQAEYEESKQIIEKLEKVKEDWIKFFNNAPTNDLITTRQSDYKKVRDNGPFLMAQKRDTKTIVDATGLIGEDESLKIVEDKLNELQKKTSAPTWAFLLVTLAELCRNLPTNKSGEQLSTSEAVDLGTVYINVKEYAKLRNITEDRARQQINDAGLFLFRLELTNDNMKFKKNGKKTREPFRTRIFSTWDPGIGVARAVFGPEIIKYFLNHPQIGYVSTRIFKIDFKNRAHAFYIYYKMCIHHGMNAGKPNSNLLSVASLLDATPSLPSYEEAGKRVGQLIRDPFEKNLNYLVNEGFLVSWNYCGEKLSEVADSHHSTLKYADWINLNIDFEIADYPEEKQQERLAKKRAQIEERKRQKAVKEELALERKEAREKKAKK